jgi:hypothetical protein
MDLLILLLQSGSSNHGRTIDHCETVKGPPLWHQPSLLAPRMHMSPLLQTKIYQVVLLLQWSISIPRTGTIHLQPHIRRLSLPLVFRHLATSNSLLLVQYRGRHLVTHLHRYLRAFQPATLRRWTRSMVLDPSGCLLCTSRKPSQRSGQVWSVALLL